MQEKIKHFYKIYLPYYNNRYLLGNLSNDGDGNKAGEKVIGLDWQNNFASASSFFLYISLPSLHDYNVEVPNFTFCRGCEHKRTTFFFFSCTGGDTVFKNSTTKKVANIWWIKQDGVRAIKFETTRIH